MPLIIMIAERVSQTGKGRFLIRKLSKEDNAVSSLAVSAGEDIKNR